MDALKKIDAVAANKIWAETLKRERACIRINEDFRVNPKLLKRNRLAAKPTAAASAIIPSRCTEDSW